MTYEELIIECDKLGLTIKEKPLKSSNGRIRGNRIAIRKDIETSVEKFCVLAEEVGHYYTTIGDILDQSTVSNRKQELRARLWVYNRQIGLLGIIRAYKAKCRDKCEIAEYLEVTEEFLEDAIQTYKSKYGNYVYIDNYIINFNPNLGVIELI